VTLTVIPGRSLITLSHLRERKRRFVFLGGKCDSVTGFHPAGDLPPLGGAATSPRPLTQVTLSVGDKAPAPRAHLCSIFSPPRRAFCPRFVVDGRGASGPIIGSAGGGSRRAAGPSGQQCPGCARGRFGRPRGRIWLGSCLQSSHLIGEKCHVYGVKRKPMDLHGGSGLTDGYLNRGCGADTPWMPPRYRPGTM